MIGYLYERLLEMQIAQSRLPGCVAVVLNCGDLEDNGLDQLSNLLNWSRSLGLGSLILYVSDDSQKNYLAISELLETAPANISLHTKEGVKNLGAGGNFKMVISLGYGGKHEVVEAFKSLLLDVETGQLDPVFIDEKAIEAHLRFRQKPDLVIRAGGKQLSDFMIWQAAYSELYFTDVNWSAFRRIDFLRAIRDCQRRERRFGH
jgi:undecaprenyl diphosphate synthase